MTHIVTTKPWFNGSSHPCNLTKLHFHFYSHSFSLILTPTCSLTLFSPTYLLISEALPDSHLVNNQGSLASTQCLIYQAKREPRIVGNALLLFFLVLSIYKYTHLVYFICDTSSPPWWGLSLSRLFYLILCHVYFLSIWLFVEVETQK